MTMSTNISFKDALHRIAQIGERIGVQLVRISALAGDNRYTARPVEFDENGQTQFVGTKTMTVTNLAEPADTAGKVPSGTDAVAVDAEGRWIVFLRTEVKVLFPARVVSSQSSAAYTVLEQLATGAGTFADKQGASNVTAHNLAELSLGPGAAVPDDTIVIVTVLMDNGSPATIRYVFDHPSYAKYLS